MPISPEISAFAKPAFITIFQRNPISRSNLIDRYATRFADQLSEIATAEPNSCRSKLRAYHGLYREALGGGTQLCLCVAFSAGRDSLNEPPFLSNSTPFHAESIAWLTRVFEAGAVRWKRGELDQRR